MKTTMHFSDRVDCTLLQRLQNVFAESIGSTVSIVDARGNLLTAPSKRSALRRGDAFPDPGAEEGAGLPGWPEPSPATVVIFASDVCLGRLVIGDAPAQAVPSDIRSLVFMPLETDQGLVGALGFGRETIRDWSPEALAHVWNFAAELAGNLDGKMARGKWKGADRIESVYGRPAPRPRMAL